MTDPVYNGPWQKLRLLILERDGYRCQMLGPKCKGLATTVDHIISVQQGGAWHDPSNLRAACGPCNYSEGAKQGNRQRQAKRTPLTW